MAYGRKDKHSEPAIKWEPQDVPLIVTPQEPPTTPGAIKVAELVRLEGRPREIPGSGVRFTVGVNVVAMRHDPLGILIELKDSDPLVIPLSHFAWLKR